MGKEGKQIFKLALTGAVLAVLVDHFIKPTVVKTVGK